jgi:hypothetical protein
MLKPLVDHVLENNTVTRTLCDGSYDNNNNNFRYLVKNNIEPAIKTRRSSKVRPTNQPTNQPTVKLEIYQLPNNNNKILKNGRISLAMDIDGWQKKLSSHQ